MHAGHVIALLLCIRSTQAECCYSFDHEQADGGSPTACCLRTAPNLGKEACDDHIADAGIVYMAWVSGECPVDASAAARMFANHTKCNNFANHTKNFANHTKCNDSAGLKPSMAILVILAAIGFIGGIAMHFGLKRFKRWRAKNAYSSGAKSEDGSPMQIKAIEAEVEGQEGAISDGVRKRQPSPRANKRYPIFDADDAAAIPMQNLQTGRHAQVVPPAPFFEADYQSTVVEHSADYVTNKQKGETRSFDQLLPKDCA